MIHEVGEGSYSKYYWTITDLRINTEKVSSNAYEDGHLQWNITPTFN